MTSLFRPKLCRIASGSLAVQRFGRLFPCKLVLTGLLLLGHLGWNLGLVAGEKDLNFFPLDAVKPGLKGIGKTVFQGDRVEEFQVEILGVLENIAPRQDAILARLSGGPLENTGVIAGMSGSPVYIDGKMVGAISFSFPFSKDAIAGITPIQQMVDIFNKPEGPVRVDPIKIEISSIPPHRTVAWQPSIDLMRVSPLNSRRYAIGESVAEGIPSLRPLSGQVFTYIDTPILLSGFSAKAAQFFEGAFKSIGMSMVQAGGVSVGSTSSKLTDGSDVQPGSSVAVQLIRGDLGTAASAAGTVTYRDGNKIYAFGHPWLSVGPVEMPFSKAKVISLISNLSSSFKIAVPTDLAGSITQDRSQGLFGTVGLAPRLIPLTINLKSSRNRLESYKYEMVNDRFLTPLLVNFTIFNTITTNERALGESTLQVQGKINVKGQPEVKIENMFSGDNNSQAFASLAVVLPLSYLMGSGFEKVDVESITVDIKSLEEKRTAVLDRVWANRSEIRAGETLTLSAYLRASNGEEHVEKIPLQIPSDVPSGTLLVTVADGSTLMAVENRFLRQTFIPRDLDQLIRAINNIRKNDRVYVRLQRPEPSVIIRGEELSSLPPSFSNVITSDRSSSSSLTTLRSSNLYEYELPSTPYVISGQRTLTLEVID